MVPIKNYMLLPLSASFDQLFSTIKRAADNSEDGSVNFPYIDADSERNRTRVLAPTAETSTAMSIRLHRVDNLATRKVAVLLCNHTYKSTVKDIDGYSVGKVFEARHKTSLMDRFLLQVLGFDSVKTHVDLDKSDIH